MSYVFDACSMLNLTRSLSGKVVDVLKGNTALSLAYYELANALWKECNLKRISFEEAAKILKFAYSVLRLMDVVHISEVNLGVQRMSSSMRTSAVGHIT